jgi:hypothetical protein
VGVSGKTIDHAATTVLNNAEPAVTLRALRFRCATVALAASLV